ncbi:cyclic peptide export ABC transporter [Beggiatoa leptomitoformis]|uniref:Cyclic peptide export ABC transporter n=1 Tax=Beggiatoa leptomitoformis TaxID=288004 RepID=A0A2N9YDT3_9GAMM|nr:cyclic peptide export ABC transporter [Beggiatoa leptomitoformis]ALG69065.1 cyclic peptide export ABC transporter [Beggiatoa leptomitoformis]AUI68525.1 cyclic peptide export ABC transporter [Beggiatoa leptomitoformis]
MEIIQFFRQETNIPIHRVITVGIIAGFANSMLLAIINIAAEQVANSVFEVQLFVLYVIAFGIFAYTQRYLMIRTTTLIEEIVRKIRVRLTDKIRHCELRFIEESGQSDFYAQITQQTSLISQISLQMSLAIQSLFVVLISLCYLLFISPLSLLMAIILLGISIPIHVLNNYKAKEKHSIVAKQQTLLFESVGNILNGFKELKFNYKKSNAVFEHLQKVACLAESAKIEATYVEVTLMTFVRLSFYILIALLIFVIPAFFESYSGEVFKVVATSLFIMGPLTVTVFYIPTLNLANITIKNIYALEDKIESHLDSQERDFAPFTTFNSLQLTDVSFSYKNVDGSESFFIQNINLSLQQGEILFIVGGNGSGKSTLLKVLTGLYYPSEGTIQLDQQLIERTHYYNYRELFSTIFTDFHLFNHLYGLDNIDEKRVHALLAELELNDKPRFINGQFTNLNLSTGQRKRLALLITLLEDKPILILDEFAADQDPNFRQYFYETLLQTLKTNGKTVIAVTHDDKYFHLADRVVKMDYGKLVAYP